ncbi:hypothetical protein DWF00_23420 [Bosea caraganae]|uniref:Type I secretion protein n=1 Tax=Bosea caraganae TaxID=2763117 RepID=A0A370L267_9HYPH|nr:hypothetical protein [Bosea caraganae]RDJ22205.1 hypothetical protein DWE98_20125 [Bosea caraganae]RDJ22708.1 hypothetical protein DWF00_23420 [Bosea caraganae]
MNSGGITEAIWHFAGYLHIAEEVARSATLYSGDPQAPLPVDDPALRREPERAPSFDEMPSQPVLIRDPAPFDPHSAIPKVVMPPPIPVGTKLYLYAPPLKPQELPAEPDLDRGPSLRSGERVIHVEYQPGGTENLIDIRQVNHASDRDLVTSDAVIGPDGMPVIQPELHLEAVRDAMIARAVDAVPDNLPAASGADTETLIDVFTARGASWAETGSPNPDGSPTQSAPVGRIVDGEAGAAEPPAPSVLQIAPWRPDEAAPADVVEKQITRAEPTGGVATLAETGLNVQINAAAIVDANEATGSLMVGGNHYFSRGIVQVNVLTDNDHVDIAVAGALRPLVVTGGNEVHNIAEFVTHVMSASVHGAAATPLWSVDVMPGDFYDVRSLFQINDLDDSDRIVQAESGTYVDLSTGGNQQINLAEIRGIDSYDIIIVRGDYYRADWIYQYNIVLDSDHARLFATGGAEDDTAVTTGFNRLTNLATIETYDSPAFRDMNDAQHELMRALGTGVTILIPNSDWNLYGAGETLHVLYVSGDYFDINSVTQVNLLTDADQSLQASAQAGTQQGLAAGGNSALNEAHIIDPGTLSAATYLGGMAYEESVLIQTNMITDSDTVTIHDTQTLLSELVAFAHDDGQDGTLQGAAPQPVDPAQHDHLMSNMLC